MSKQKKETEIKKEDLKEQLKGIVEKYDSIKKEIDATKEGDLEALDNIVEKYNEAFKVRNINDEIAKRCLGAIELLQSLIGEEKAEDAEIRKEE